MKKLLVILSCALLLVMMIATPALAIVGEQNKDYEFKNIQNLRGTIHKDGSYQFSNEELKKFNYYKTNINSNSSIAELIEYAAPEFYSVLPQQVKLQMKNDFKNEVTTLSDSHAPGWMSGTSTSISRYGASLKGYSEIRRSPVSDLPKDFEYLYVVNEMFNSSGTSVALSVGVDYFPFVSCTNMIEPPTGVYYARGDYEIPWHCSSCSSWSYAHTFSVTGDFSYINPYSR